MILIENLSKTYTLNQKTFAAIDKVNLSVSKNQIFGIVGPSGAGKSTLIRCVNRLEEADGGRIWIEGQEMGPLSKKALLKKRQKIGMIFQDFNLFQSKTVFQNVAYPLEIAKRKDAWIQKQVSSLLFMVGIEEKKNAYPATLSGGQKQRVAIARALANEPNLLLCDEATSALDPETTRAILALIRKLKEALGLTVLLITHQMEVVRDACDQVAIMDQGRIIEQGKVSQVFLHPQMEITQNFIRHLSPTREEVYLNQTEGTLVKLHFSKENANLPIIHRLLKAVDVEINILSGDISALHTGNVGYLILSFSGTSEKIKKALSYLDQNHVFWEVLNR